MPAADHYLMMQLWVGTAQRQRSGTRPQPLCPYPIFVLLRRAAAAAVASEMVERHGRSVVACRSPAERTRLAAWLLLV